MTNHHQCNYEGGHPLIFTDGTRATDVAVKCRCDDVTGNEGGGGGSLTVGYVSGNHNTVAFTLQSKSGRKHELDEW